MGSDGEGALQIWSREQEMIKESVAVPNAF